MHGAIILVTTLSLGVDFGWETNDLGELEYIIQIHPLSLDEMRDGQIITSEIHPDVRGVRHFRIQVGRQELPRDAGSFVPSQPTVQLDPVVVQEPPEVSAIRAGDPNAPSLSIPEADQLALQHPPATSRFTADTAINPAVDVTGANTSLARPASTELVAPRDDSPPAPTSSPTLILPQGAQDFNDALNRGDEVAPSDVSAVPSEAFPTEYDTDYSHPPRTVQPAHDGYESQPVHQPPASYPHDADYPVTVSPQQPSRNIDDDRNDSWAPKYPPEISSARDRHQTPREYSSPASESSEIRRTSIDRETIDDREPDDELPRSLQRSGDRESSAIRAGIGSGFTSEQAAPRKPWAWVLAFFATLASNVFMGWVTWTAVYRYRELVDDMRAER